MGTKNWHLYGGDVHVDVDVHVHLHVHVHDSKRIPEPAFEGLATDLMPDVLLVSNSSDV